MILVIEGLPSTTSANELRNLVKLQTNVTDYMLDDLVADELGYMVARLHVRDSNEGSLIMQVLEGSLYAAHRLRVRPFIEPAQTQGGGGGSVAYYGAQGGGASAGAANVASAGPPYGATQHYSAYPTVQATPTYIPVQQMASSGVATYGAPIQPVIHSSVAVYRTGYGESYTLPGTDPRTHHYAPAIAQVHQQDPFAYQKGLGEPRMKDDYRRHKDRRSRSRSPPRDRLPRRFKNERRSRSLEKVPPPPPQISRSKRDKSFDQDYNMTRKIGVRVNEKKKNFQEAYPDSRDIQQSQRERVKSMKGREFDENERPEMRKLKDIPIHSGPKAVRPVYEDSDRANDQTKFETDSHLKRHKDLPGANIYDEPKRIIPGSNNMPNVQHRYFQDDNKSREMQNKGRGNQFNKNSRDDPFSSTKKSPQRTPPIELLRYDKSASNPTKKQHQESMKRITTDFINKPNVQSKNNRTRLRSASPEPAYKKRVPEKFQTQVKQQTLSKGQTPPPLEKRFRKNANKAFANSNNPSGLYNEVNLSQMKSSAPGRHAQNVDKSSTKNTHPINVQSYSKSHIANEPKQRATELNNAFDVYPRVGNKIHFDKNKSVKKDIRKPATDDNLDRHYPTNSRREQEIRRPTRDVKSLQDTTESTTETRVVWEDVNVLDDQYTPPRPQNKSLIPDDPWAPNSRPNQVAEIPIKTRPIVRSAGQVMQDSSYNSNADTRPLYKTNRETVYGRPSFASEDKANLAQTPPLPEHFIGKDRRGIINENRLAASSTNERAFPKAAKVSLMQQLDEQVDERNFDDRRSRQNKPAAFAEKRPLQDKSSLPIAKKPAIQAYDSREQVPVDYPIHEDERHAIRKVDPRPFREQSPGRIVRVVPDEIARKSNRRSRSHEVVYPENKRRPMTPPRLVQRPMREEVSRENVAPMVDDSVRDPSKYLNRNRRIDEEPIGPRSFSEYDRPVKDGLVDVRRPSEAKVPRSPRPDYFHDRRPVEFEDRRLSPHVQGDRQHPPPDIYDAPQHPPRDMYDDRRRPLRDEFDDRRRPLRDEFDDRQRPPRDEFDDRQRPPRVELDDRKRPPRDEFDERQRPLRDEFDERQRPPRDEFDHLQRPPLDEFHGRKRPPRDEFDDPKRPPRDEFDDRKRPPRDEFDDRKRPPRDEFDDRKRPPRDEFDDRKRPPRDEFDDRKRPLREEFNDRKRPPRDEFDDRQRLPPRDEFDDRQRPPRDVYDDRGQPTRDVYDAPPLEMHNYRQVPPPDMYVDRSPDLRPRDDTIEHRAAFDRRSPYIRPGSPGYEDWKYRERILSPERHSRDYYRPEGFDEREMPPDLRFEEERAILPVPDYEGYDYDSRQHDGYVSPRHRGGDIDGPFDDYFDKRYPERHEFNDRRIHTEDFPVDQPEYPYSPRRSRDEHLVEPIFDTRHEYQVEPLHEEIYPQDKFDLRMQIRNRDRGVDQEHKASRPSRPFEGAKRNVQQSLMENKKANDPFVKSFKQQPKKFSARPRLDGKLPPKRVQEARKPVMKPRKLPNETPVKKIVKPSKKTDKIELPVNAEDGRYLATNKLAFITMKHHEDLLPNFRLRKRAMIDMRKLIGDRIDRMFKDRFVTNIQAIVKEYRAKYSSKDDTATLKKIIDELPAFIKTGRVAPKQTSNEVQTKPSPKKLSTQLPKKPKEGVSTVRKKPAGTLTAKGGRKPGDGTLAKKTKVQR